MPFPAHAEEVLYLYNITENETTITPSPKNTISNPAPSKRPSLMKSQGLVVKPYFGLTLSREIPSLTGSKGENFLDVNSRLRSSTFNSHSIANTMIIRTLYRASRVAVPRRLPIPPCTSPGPCRFTITSVSQLSNLHRSYATKTTIDEKIEELQEL